MKTHTLIGERLCGELRTLRNVRPIVRSPPPRAAGWERLSGRIVRRGHSSARSDCRYCRRLRRADDRPALQGSPVIRSGDEGAPSRSRARLATGRSRRRVSRSDRPARESCATGLLASSNTQTDRRNLSRGLAHDELTPVRFLELPHQPLQDNRTTSAKRSRPKNRCQRPAPGREVHLESHATANCPVVRRLRRNSRRPTVPHLRFGGICFPLAMDTR
jgi:hypothetical protein